VRELVCFDGGEAFASEFMKAIQGYHLIKPEDLFWRPSNLMKIPNADFLERTGSENLGARLWRLPPQSANTLHKHVRAEEFYFVLGGVERLRVGDETLTVPKHSGGLIWKATITPWPPGATTAMASRARNRSSSACCATARGGP
jgi:uncharacterized RmlC-like cupin family protein